MSLDFPLFHPCVLRNPWHISGSSQVLNELLREDGAVGPEAGKPMVAMGPKK